MVVSLKTLIFALNKKIGGFMEILNKEFWEKRDAAMKRFMASKERQRKRMAELE